jgi:hypothetical protein
MLGPSPPRTILDTGSSGHFFNSNDPRLQNRNQSCKPVTIQVANQQTMQSTQTAVLPIPALPPEAQTGYITEELGQNLLSTAPLTKAGCTVNINQHRAVIQCPNLPPLHCPTAPDGLIDVPVDTNTATHSASLPDQPFQAHATIGNSNHPADLVAFHHASLFSPSLTTLEQAMIKKYLPPLPGLNFPTLRRLRPDLEAW